MVVTFTKMNGAGNDFVLIDNRTQKISLTTDQIRHLCDRHRGAGADGVILLKPCTSGKAEWAWDFYNNDGSEAEMCGNGSRCFGRFVRRLTGNPSGFTFETRAGIITARFKGEAVTINLTPPKEMRLEQMVPLSIGATAIHSLDTGVPHAVIFVDDADQTRVKDLGSEIRFHPHFAPRGTNVNFVQVLEGNTIRVRTYERGVEDETLACGTGVTAAALVAAELRQLRTPVPVRVQGGDVLEVSFDRNGRDYTNIALSGPADFVFEGTIEL